MRKIAYILIVLCSVGLLGLSAGTHQEDAVDQSFGGLEDEIGQKKPPTPTPKLVKPRVMKLITTTNQLLQVLPPKERIFEERAALRARIEDRFRRLYAREKKLGREVKRGEPFVAGPE